VIQTAAKTALQLGDQTDPDEHRSLWDVIRRNSNLAVLLLHRLALARDVEAGTVSLDLAAVDLAQLVAEAPAVETDETAQREIIFNLLSNAAKYSGSSTPIVVTVGAVDDAARVEVRNHGTGVAADDTEYIFEKFRQLDETSPGSGLGLFISQGLVRVHGGDILVQPAADEGSQFELRLPLPIL
jgi:signal transduction histidine kinase